LSRLPLAPAFAGASFGEAARLQRINLDPRQSSSAQSHLQRPVIAAGDLEDDPGCWQEIAQAINWVRPLGRLANL
jgi:hypothetical protein